MTIGQQNQINALYGMQALQAAPGDYRVEVVVSLPDAVVAAITAYLDKHPEESWDSLIEDAIRARLGLG